MTWSEQVFLCSESPWCPDVCGFYKYECGMLLQCKYVQVENSYSSGAPPTFHRRIKVQDQTIEPVIVYSLRKAKAETCAARDEQRAGRTANVSPCLMCHNWKFHYGGKVTHMHAMSSTWQGWMEEDTVSWGWDESQLARNLFWGSRDRFSHAKVKLYFFFFFQRWRYMIKFAFKGNDNRKSSTLILSWQTRVLPKSSVIWDASVTLRKSMHTHKQDSTPPRPDPQIPQPRQLYILRFYDLDLICKCHRVAGINLSERAPPTRPSCFDPTSCGHRSSCPLSRCESGGISELQ